MGRKLDITGKRSGKLVAIKESDLKDNYGHIYWECRCDCGKTHYVLASKITHGSVKSCGCDRYKHMHKKHGETGTRLYKCWQDMKARCYRENNKNYKGYGGRGITVCDSWKLSFENFRDWALKNGYEDYLEIDRINVNGSYSPENCRWADRVTQTNNTRRNRFLEYNGAVRTMSEWSKQIGIPYTTLRARINTLHWPVEKALTYTKDGD